MSARDVDRLIGAYLELEAPPNPPAGLLDRTLETSSRTRQRPGWLASLKGTHMSTTARLARMPQMRAAPILILVGLLVAALAAALLLVGSQTRLPPPIGLARSGLIAFDSDGKLYVANADGSGARPLEGQGQEISVSPMFSPDGRAIAYWSQPSRDTDYSLWIREADGSNARLIAGPFHGRPARFGQTLAWSPDSRRLAFSAAEGGDPRLYVVDAAGGSPTPLGDDRLDRSQPAWSPDGSRLAYFGRLQGDLYGFDTGIYVMNVDGTAEQKVSSSTGSMQYGSLQHPKWSPDGQRLLYQVGGEEASFEIAVARADGSGENILLPGEIEELFPVWSPDGSQIAFQRRIGPRAVGPY